MKGIGMGKKGRKILSFFVFGIIVIGSCTKINEFTIGKDFVESETRLQVIDTFRVDLSTILLDSVITSSKNIAYVGKYEDNVFGSISCDSYFNIAYESFSDIEEKATYDSSSFILNYTDYNFGDTTSLMSISIHRLTEKIEPYDGLYLFNTSSFHYESQAAGMVSFYPEPHSSDTAVSVPVNALGEELFNLIRNKDERVSTQEWFTDYLKGFVLTSGNAENKALIGFKASSERLVMKIYYHLDKEELVKKEITIKMGDAAHQFNNVKFDLTNTALYNIKMERNEVPSVETGNQAFMQGMIGLLPKIKFPSLQNVLAEERWKILKAELIIEPVQYSYDLFGLPDSLFIYRTDKENRRTVLYDDKSRPMIASFKLDKYLPENNRYTYDITSYINQELSDAYVDSESGLIVGLNEDKLESSFERLLVETRHPRVKLKIYYLSY
jgi:Domain of unknown function (DUF4270)